MLYPLNCLIYNSAGAGFNEGLQVSLAGGVWSFNQLLFLSSRL